MTEPGPTIVIPKIQYAQVTMVPRRIGSGDSLEIRVQVMPEGGEMVEQLVICHPGHDHFRTAWETAMDKALERILNVLEGT